MITNNILTLINESYIFSNKTISVDLDKFESGEINKILLCGLSGSGKTSTGLYLQNKYNIPLLDTDDIQKPVNDQYPRDQYSAEFRFNKFNEQFNKIITNNDRLIIAGVGISLTYDFDKTNKGLILNNSFIFLGKSALKSSWDAYMRMRRTGSKKNFWDALNWNFNIYYKKEMQLKTDRCNIPNSKIEEFKFDYKQQ